MKNLFALLVIGVLSTGCSTFGLAPAKTLDEKLAYSYASVTASLNTIASATNSGLLNSSQAEKANGMVLQAKATLDAARMAENTSPNEATNDLALATAVLASVQQFLQSNGVKK